MKEEFDLIQKMNDKHTERDALIRSFKEFVDDNHKKNIFLASIKDEFKKFSSIDAINYHHLLMYKKISEEDFTTICEIITKMNLDINEPDYLGESILHYTSIKNPDHIGILLEKFPNINVNLRNEYGISALQMLALYGKDLKDSTPLKILMDHGANMLDLNQDTEASEFQLAFISNNTNIASFILDRMKAEEINFTYPNGMSFIHHSAYMRNINFFNLILDKNIIPPYHTDKQGNSALIYAMLPSRIVPNHEDDIRNMNNIIEKFPGIEKMPNYLGLNPWQLASVLGYKEVIDYYYKEGLIDINQIDKQGSGLIHYAATKGYEPIITYFIDELKIDKNSINYFGWNILHFATYNNNSNGIDFLLNNYNVSAALDYHGNDLLDLALLTRNQESKRIIASNDHIELSEGRSLANNKMIVRISDNLKISMCHVKISDIINKFSNSLIKSIGIRFDISDNNLTSIDPIFKKIICGPYINSTLNDSGVDPLLFGRNDYYLSYNKSYCNGYESIVESVQNGNVFYYCKKELNWQDHLLEKLSNLWISIKNSNEVKNISDNTIEYIGTKVGEAIKTNMPDLVTFALLANSFGVIAIFQNLGLIKNTISSVCSAAAGACSTVSKILFKITTLFSFAVVTHKLISNEYSKKLIGDLVKDENKESAINNISPAQKQATEKVHKIFASHPTEWLYSVESPAKCLDDKENGHKALGKKEEINIYQDNNGSLWSVCYRDEPRPETHIPSVNDNLYKSTIIKIISSSFAALSGLGFYHLKMENYLNIKISTPFGVYVGVSSLLENVLHSNSLLSSDQILANQYIDGGEKEAYLVESPGVCLGGEADLLAKFGSWQVCELVGEINLANN